MSTEQGVNARMKALSKSLTGMQKRAADPTEILLKKLSDDILRKDSLLLRVYMWDMRDPKVFGELIVDIFAEIRP